MDRRPHSSPNPEGQSAAPATPRDLGDLTPQTAQHLLVQTLLRIGLDLHAAIALAAHSPVRLHLHDALLRVDEAVRQVRLNAFERLTETQDPDQTHRAD
ncbi:MAG TPA: hypothetical protein VFN97_00980 [Actinospica sp.]|nr:hypothetical protein [Actinospica sp.]